ncbi:MAG: TraY domain-containing protein [Sulfuriferula sp.]
MMAISIRLPSDIEARLQSLVELTGRSKTFYVTEAILEHLDNLEDVYLAGRELAAVRSGASTTITLAEAMQQYGMDD